MDTSEFRRIFIETLPDFLKPTKEIPSLNTSLVKAKNNGWNPDELAQAVVAGAKWAGKESPIGLMVHVCGEKATTRPPAIATGESLLFVMCWHGEPKGAHYCALCRRGIELPEDINPSPEQLLFHRGLT